MSLTDRLFQSLLQKFSTPPGKLVGVLAITTISSVLVAGTSYLSLTTAKNNVGAIRDQLAPQLVATQRVVTSSSQVSANLANLLVGNNTTSMKAIDAANKQLPAAVALLHSSDPESQKLIEKMVAGVLEEQRWTTTAQDLFEKRDPAALAAERHVLKAVQQEIAEPAQKLTASLAAQIAQARNNAAYSIIFGGLLVVIVGTGTFAYLFSVQSWMSKTTNRTFNIGLLVSTGTVLVFAAVVSVNQLFSLRSLDAALNQALATVEQANQASLMFHDAHQTLSSSLVEPFDKPQRRSAAMTILTRISTEVLPTLKQSLNTDADVQGTKDLFDATDTYRGIAGAVSNSEATGDHAQAIDRMIGTNPGEANYAIAAIEKFLGQLEENNLNEFQSQIDQSFDRVSIPVFVLLLVPMIVVGSAVLGLRRRFQDLA